MGGTGSTSAKQFIDLILHLSISVQHKMSCLCSCPFVTVPSLFFFGVKRSHMQESIAGGNSDLAAGTSQVCLRHI